MHGTIVFNIPAGQAYSECKLQIDEDGLAVSTAIFSPWDELGADPAYIRYASMWDTASLKAVKFSLTPTYQGFTADYNRVNVVTAIDRNGVDPTDLVGNEHDGIKTALFDLETLTGRGSFKEQPLTTSSTRSIFRAIYPTSL